MRPGGSGQSGTLPGGYRRSLCSRSASAAPLVQTDRTGYKAGETVRIIGTGFLPNESITIRVTHADGGAETGGGHEPQSAAAGPDGALTASWSIYSYDTGGNNFVVTAEGASGRFSSSFRRIAVVHTDRFDYEPRPRALITGSGFFPNELVTLQVMHLNGRNAGAGHLPFTAAADPSGNISASWLVRPDDSERSLLTLTATGPSGLKALTVFLDPPIKVVDDGGPDDLVGQKDLTQLTIDFEAMPATLGLVWHWDDTAWSGNNTGDACALFDTDGDGLANFSLCVSVDGNPATYKAARLYTCGNTRADRCTMPAPVASFASTCTAAATANSDPFGNGSYPSHTAGDTCSSVTGCYSADTVGACTVQIADLGGAAGVLPTNVCSYPSESPNSDPADCVILRTTAF